ncbi:MAG: hypothetical protein ACW98K_03750 [Candidatus Kariarchaeaceae archaeon]
MDPITIPQTTILWLLEDDNPPVRNLTKQFLIGKTVTASETDGVNQYAPIKELLSQMKPNGSWSDPKKPYQKYVGDYWQIIFLCDLHAHSLDKQIQMACTNVFTYQLSDGTFPMQPRAKRTSIMCLTANILRSLVYFGFIDDERVQKGINTITDHLIRHKGILCTGMSYSLLSDCQMALSKFLAMYEMIDRKHRNKKINRAISIIIEKITENQIFRYLPVGTKEFKQLIKGKKLAEIREIRREVVTDAKRMKKGIVKRGWQKFGFPHSYTSDLLETLYYLAKIDVKVQDEFQEGLDCVISNMNPEGKWTNEIKFKNPMLVEIEPKHSPSKWITFRACYLLKQVTDVQFGN